MDPAMLAYYQMAKQRQAMPQNQGQLQAPPMQEAQFDQGEVEAPSPLLSGVNAARSAAKESLGMDERERQRAMGLAMMQFGASMGRPGYGPGFAGTLNAINQSILPAANAYSQEEARIANMNAYLQAEEAKKQQEAMRMAQKMQESQALQKHREFQEENKQKRHEEQLASREKYQQLGLSIKQQGLGLKQKQLEDKYGRVAEVVKGLYNTDYIPINSVSKDEAKDYAKSARVDIKSLDVNKRAIKAVKDMKEIFEEYPDIGNSFLNYLVAENNGDLDLWQRAIRQSPYIDKKKISAIEELQKLTADIQYDVIMGDASSSGSRPTDALKKIIQHASATGKSTKDAFDFVGNNIIDKGLHNIRKIEIIEDAMKKRMIPLFSSMKEEAPSKSPANSISSPNTAAVQTSKEVSVEMPDGVIWTIPAENLDGALARGGKRIE